MKEYIEKSAAIHAVLHNSGQAAVAAVQEIKVEDVAPVVHGEWIDAEYDEYELEFGRHLYFCSVCGKHADSFVGGSEEWWCRRKPNYCPNCGARMKGEQEKTK